MKTIGIIALTAYLMAGLGSATASECRLSGRTQKIPVWKNEEALEKGEEILKKGDSPFAAARHVACIVDPGTKAEIVRSTEKLHEIVTLDGARAGCRGTVSAAVCSSKQAWGAISYAMTKKDVVTAVIANQTSREKAEEAALAKCREKGVPGCKIGHVFTDCGYVTAGKGPKGTEGFAVAWASTSEAATRNCLTRGAVTCSPPAGACNN